MLIRGWEHFRVTWESIITFYWAAVFYSRIHFQKMPFISDNEYRRCSTLNKFFLSHSLTLYWYKKATTTMTSSSGGYMCCCCFALYVKIQIYAQKNLLMWRLDVRALKSEWERTFSKNCWCFCCHIFKVCQSIVNWH